MDFQENYHPNSKKKIIQSSVDKTIPEHYQKKNYLKLDQYKKKKNSRTSSMCVNNEKKSTKSGFIQKNVSKQQVDTPNKKCKKIGLKGTHL